MLRVTESSVPKHLFAGELGPELIAISLPEVRIAQRLHREEKIETADGQLTGRAGDFVVTLGTERYPIPASVFFGTYEILGKVGSRFVGRRLLHTRRAWPIKSSHATFDYGPKRGKVVAPKGGWVYRSDEDDFGVINADAKEQAHTVVGPAAELAGKNWDRRFRQGTFAISLLPPLLAFVALAAYTASLNEDYSLSRGLLLLEAFLFTLGVGLVWWIRRKRWALRAAVASGIQVARDFQLAVELLGQKPSETFPGMSLWRAAQCDGSSKPDLSPQGLRSLTDQIYRTYDRVRQECDLHHTFESRANALSWVAAGTVLACILYAAWTHSEDFEILAIWLPSVVGTVHASVWRRQLVRRIGAGREFLAELSFAGKRLLALAPGDQRSLNPVEQTEVLATLQMLCRAVGQHAQHQIGFAISENPHVPL
jgi:hypothetical protein